jgi:mediator of RNA polymerase II transcription subunit 14
MGKKAGTSAVIRMSKRIVYDSAQAVVSFLSEDVDTCVDEFLEEWAKVSKMVVIAREGNVMQCDSSHSALIWCASLVAQMAKECKWPDVRLLMFDLQTVEFAYAGDHTVAVTCANPSQGSTYDLRFGRAGARDGRTNPHEETEGHLSTILQHGRLAPSLRRLVSLLRDTLPIVTELEDIQTSAARDGHVIDTYAKSAGWYRIVYGDRR